MFDSDVKDSLTSANDEKQNFFLIIMYFVL